MAHIEKRSDRRKPWRVRYRDPLGRERSKSFARKADADRFMATAQADLIRGDRTDPRLSKITYARPSSGTKEGATTGWPLPPVWRGRRSGCRMCLLYGKFSVISAWTDASGFPS